MKLTIFSNFLNHHQIPLCDQFYARLGEDFCFVATECTDPERLKLGYPDVNETVPYCLPAYLSEENYQKAIKLAEESEIVIHGSAPQLFVDLRMRENKLTFRYLERIFKKPYYYLMPGFYRLYRKYQDKELYYLCCGGYVKKDLMRIRQRQDGYYRWGYFPRCQESPQKQSREILRLLWCGRMISWKHPKLALKIAGQLKKEGYAFQLVMIGTGKLEESIRNDISREKLENHVKMTGALPAEEVRGWMQEADIFLFTSDQTEGWGAVLNEAMNSRCAVVADERIGAVPYLIQDQYNGLVYRSWQELMTAVKRLMQDYALRKKLGDRAFSTIKETWNAEIAAIRFLALAEALQKHTAEPEFLTGPCSKA